MTKSTLAAMAVLAATASCTTPPRHAAAATGAVSPSVAQTLARHAGALETPIERANRAPDGALHLLPAPNHLFTQNARIVINPAELDDLEGALEKLGTMLHHIAEQPGHKKIQSIDYISPRQIVVRWD